MKHIESREKDRSTGCDFPRRFTESKRNEWKALSDFLGLFEMQSPRFEWMWCQRGSTGKKMSAFFTVKKDTRWHIDDRKPIYRIHHLSVGQFEPLVRLLWFWLRHIKPMRENFLCSSSFSHHRKVEKKNKLWKLFNDNHITWNGKSWFILYSFRQRTRSRWQKETKTEVLKRVTIETIGLLNFLKRETV